MSVMVTGATGFIGNRIVRKLVERGEEVVCFDLAPPRANLQPYMDRLQFYRGDIMQMPHLLDAVNTHQVDRIIHMAALLPPDTEERPHFGMLVNIQGTNNIFEVSRWTGVQRVVYASSIATFGVQETFGERPVNEDDLSAPVNVYGMTKAANDFAAGRYADRYGLDIVGIRICTVFGHGRVTGMTGIIGGLLMSLPAVGQPISMPFHRDEPSPMIHAEDAAEIFVRASLERPPQPPDLHKRRALGHHRRYGRLGQEVHPRRRHNHWRPSRSPHLLGGQQPDAGRHRLRTRRRWR